MLGGDIILKVFDDEMEVIDKGLLEKMGQNSTLVRCRRLTPAAVSTPSFDVAVEICEIASLAFLEAVVTILMLLTTCSRVSDGAASAPWAMKAREATAAMARNNIAIDR